MTPLELLAAKVRGADSNVDGARIIKNWYDEQTKHTISLAKSSAKNMRDSEALADGLREQIAVNFDSCADLLTINN